MNCREARPLVPAYLDAEISEAQAAPLRQHLIECRTCRAAVQEEKALKGWFVDPKPLTIPQGFAARVARRALAGDTGERYDAPAAERVSETPILQFVLQATAIAATLLFALAIGMRTQELPEVRSLQADSASYQGTLNELDRLNRAEEAAEPAEDEAEER